MFATKAGTAILATLSAVLVCGATGIIANWMQAENQVLAARDAAAKAAAAPLPIEDPCRSVWLQYRGGEGVVFYNELTVSKSAAGTNFIACGWDRGWFGLSENSNGKKGIEFTVFDSPDPQEDVKLERVRVDYQDPSARKGNPIHNSASIDFDYDWDVDKAYCFAVTAALDPKTRRTVYAGHILSPDAKKWKRLATVSTVMGDGLLRDYRSNIEGYPGTKTTQRTAHFGNGWVKSRDGSFLDGQWFALAEAKFILGGGGEATNYNAKADGSRFLLATGGDVKNTDVKWGEKFTVPLDKKQKPPEGIPGQ